MQTDYYPNTRMHQCFLQLCLLHIEIMYFVFSVCEDNSFCNSHGTCSYDMHRKTCDCDEGKRVAMATVSMVT